MKGLLLKDVYMMKAYCRTYVVVAVLFLGVSLAGNESPFFLYYPCVLCALIPTTLLAYDERGRFLAYGAALPYSKAQYVTAKYILGLLVLLVMWLITAAAKGSRLLLLHDFAVSAFLTEMALIFALSCAAVAFSLPVMFRFGVEKGRIAYYVIIGAACASAVLAGGAVLESPAAAPQLTGIALGIMIAALAVYALSWRLSIRAYNKRVL